MSEDTVSIPGEKVDRLYAQSESEFERWETIKDLIDEMIDLMLNYRQSGHPGGSRSKVHGLVATLLSGAARWDLLRPWRPFQDRFVLSAGHTVPLVYAMLAVFNEAIREAQRRGGDASFEFPDDGRFALTWESLLELRRRGGLPGHAEMEGKTLFLKFNTGPSGHGMPPAAGQALALKRAGLEEVKVFAFEGEGGLTPGASHETKNTAWGLGLSNLVFVIDWNDYGIDPRPASSVVHGTPDDWFRPYGWRVVGTERGMEWGPVTRAVLEATRGENRDGAPTMVWLKTTKGRDYGKVDAASHGSPHKMNSPDFWTVRKRFMEKYGVEYRGVDQAAPGDPIELQRQAEGNFRVALGVLHRDDDLVQYLSERILATAREVPDTISTFAIGGTGASLIKDEKLYDFRNYPASVYRKAGDKQPNRAALAAWGSWINAYAKKKYGRPLFLACSADLANSTNIAGFAADHGDLDGWGWFDRCENPNGTLLPQEITEFTNAGLMAGLASVNLADDPMAEFNGFWGAHSTYGSFSYLKYGPMRLFSQLAQDSEIKVGKVLWIAGHSGPETAEDSRTHFGIFAPGVTQLFPDGQVIDLHPWEYNEVPVVLGASLKTPTPIVALHLTRPPITLPDREAVGMPSHFEAARGAYVLREYRKDKPKMGTVFVQGTSTTANLVRVLPELDQAGLNVKVVAAISPQLFALQDASYREKVASESDRCNAMCITSRAIRLMRDWIANDVVAEYSMSSDWDDRWRTGGSVEDVVDEAHLASHHILEGIERFVRDREARARRLRDTIAAAFPKQD